MIRLGDEIEFVLDHPNAKQPAMAYEGDAGYDLYVVNETLVAAHSFVDVHHGIRIKLPAGKWARITGRSSTLRKLGLLVNESVIDNGWRGELFAGVRSLSDEDVVLHVGDRIAQLILFDRITAPWIQVNELGDHSRGERGFGSTGR